MTFTISSVEELPSVAKECLALLRGRTVIALSGTLGAGKTTFVKSLCTLLGVTDAVTSPTFAIVNEYSTSADDIIYHIDLYRMNTLDECFAIGLEDYLYSRCLCLIEWPELVECLLPDNTMTIHFTIVDNNTRNITIE